MLLEIPEPGIALILLAAGGSRRLGQPKQLTPWRGKSLLRAMAETALKADRFRVHVVLGKDHEVMGPELGGLPVILTINRDSELGMGSSIAAGLRTVLAEGPDYRGVLVMLCDQLRLQASHLQELHRGFLENPDRLIASSYAGIAGVPAIFPRVYFPELLTLEGDQGGKAILRKNADRVLTIPFPEGGIDLDLPEDLVDRP